MTNQHFSADNIAFDFPFDTPLHRLIMVYIQISGSGDGGKEKLISDSTFIKICCCTSSYFTDAVTFLLENGFIAKCNYGMQFGEACSGYVITVPDELRRAHERTDSTT